MADIHAVWHMEETMKLENMATWQLEEKLNELTDGNYHIINASDADANPNPDYNFTDNIGFDHEWTYQVYDQPYYGAESYRDALMEAIDVAS